MCSLPRNEDSATKRTPMPSPQKHGSQKTREIALEQIPVPEFGGRPAAAIPTAQQPAKTMSDRKLAPALSTSSLASSTVAATVVDGGAPAPLEPAPDFALPVAPSAPSDEPSLEPAEPVAAPAAEPAIAAAPTTEPAASRSAVKVWDFATGRPLPDLVPVSTGRSQNDNQPNTDAEAVPSPEASVTASALAEAAVQPSPPRAETAAIATAVAAAGEAGEVASAVSAANDQAAPDVLPEPASTRMESAAAAPAAPASTSSAAPQQAAAEDRPMPEPAAPAAGSASSAVQTARVWDFATGRPLLPHDQPAVVAEAGSSAPVAPPRAAETGSADDALAQASVPAPPAEPSPAVAAGATATAGPAASEKLRVWDFRTGKPLPPVASPAAATAPAPTTGQGHAAAPSAPASTAPINQVIMAAAPPDPPWPSAAPLVPPVLSPQDELILEVKVKDVDAADTVIAYGAHGGIYLPLGVLARILDLAITVSDDGHYANGWVLDDGRQLTINLRDGTIEFKGERRPIPVGVAVAYDGELYLRVDQFAGFLPVKMAADLRTMAVEIETLEPFPFQLRAQRESQRQRLASRQGQAEVRDFERIDLPWVALSVPAADVEVRAVSDSTYGARMEGDLRLAGDLGFLTAEAYLSGETKNGLTASLLELGRVDPDGQLLGPLKATAFSVGDTATETMPLGLRSVSGRGFAVTNAATQMASVFDRVDLRGILPAGYEVELYRNDILIGSTRDAVNGQYEFLQVPVDFGLNVFRLVFFGPQGQRSETVRRISVGDGRVGKGQLVYSFGAAQRDRNVLGVEPPNFSPPAEYGEWRASGQLAYGVSSGLTAVLGGAFFERDGARWLSSAGVRTSIGGLAVKADLGAADGGALAFSGGLGGRIGGSAVTISHSEYSGLFPDETKFSGAEFMRRATELDFNTTVKLGASASVPVTARVRRYDIAGGGERLLAGVRASTRTSGLLLSNTLDYSRTSGAGFAADTQLLGNFDLATAGRSDTRARFALGYQLLPGTKLTNAGVEIDHALDEDTSLRASASYAFDSKSPAFGASAVRDFDRFSLAFDGNYSFANDSYFVGLRFGFSLGRDPLSKRVFMARPGQATSGAATLRAFQDMNGDGLYGPADKPLPDVDFVAFNQTATTDTAGIARVGGLGTGREVAIQIDRASLPDISLAPAKPGIELVPRPGRLHAVDYPVVALSEVEGTASFVSDGATKGVSGVRLSLTEVGGKLVGVVRTELDGYFFFEQVPPGRYRLTIDPDQVSRLKLCPLEAAMITVGFESEIVTRDIEIRTCEAPKPVIAQAQAPIGPQDSLAGATGSPD
ncbi:MAG: hypothetical protein ACO25F_10130 [Erythrobacter sp.]